MTHLNKEIKLIMHHHLIALQGDDRQNGLPWWAWLLILLAPILVLLWWLRRRTGAQAPAHKHSFYQALDAAAPGWTRQAGFDSSDAVGSPDVTGVATPDEDDTVDEGDGAPPDDLTVIEGIGPKLSAILNEAGITTVVQLAGATVQDIQSILRAAGHRIADPTSWPDQARLLAAGDTEGFQALIARLKGGRYVS